MQVLNSKHPKNVLLVAYKNTFNLEIINPTNDANANVMDVEKNLAQEFQIKMLIYFFDQSGMFQTWCYYFDCQLR